MITILAHGQTLFDLRACTGDPATIAARLPDSPGIYAWFPTFDVACNDPAQFVDSLIDCMERSKFAERTSNIQPNHRIRLQSHTAVPRNTIEALRKFATLPAFRTMLSHVLAHTQVFSSPLYIGKAINLRQRVTDHLLGNTPLKSRLAQASINILRTQLYIFEAPSLAVDGADDADTKSIELLMEDLFSRLFCPSFTLRYG